MGRPAGPAGSDVGKWEDKGRPRRRKASSILRAVGPGQVDATPAREPTAAMTVGRAWKFRRNLVIFIASGNGCSQRMLADVFDLPHSRINAIIKEFRSKYAGPTAD